MTNGLLSMDVLTSWLMVYRFVIVFSLLPKHKSACCISTKLGTTLSEFSVCTMLDNNAKLSVLEVRSSVFDSADEGGKVGTGERTGKSKSGTVDKLESECKREVTDGETISSISKIGTTKSSSTSSMLTGPSVSVMVGDIGAERESKSEVLADTGADGREMSSNESVVAIGDDHSDATLESVDVLRGTSNSGVSRTAGYSLTVAVHSRFPGDHGTWGILHRPVARNNSAPDTPVYQGMWEAKDSSLVVC